MGEFPSKSNQWKKGESGNPNGRRGSIKDLLNNLLDENVQLEDGTEVNKKEALAKSLYRLALRGNMTAMRELLDRSEGKVKDVVEVREEKKMYDIDTPVDRV